MTDDVSVQFRVYGEGWANIELNLGARKHVIQGVSYTTDALGDLVRAALTVATGGQRGSVSFDGEPVETRLVLESLLDMTTGKGPVALTVLSFEDFCRSEPNEKGHREFYGDCDAVAFAHAVACAKSLSADFSWGDHPYPLSAVRALETALSTA